MTNTFYWPPLFAKQACKSCTAPYRRLILCILSFCCKSVFKSLVHWTQPQQLCVRAQPCMQGSGDAAYLLCMLCCLYIQQSTFDASRTRSARTCLTCQAAGCKESQYSIIPFICTGCAPQDRTGTEATGSLIRCSPSRRRDSRGQSSCQSDCAEVTRGMHGIENTFESDQSDACCLSCWRGC
jgi:hypothetical protein